MTCSGCFPSPIFRGKTVYFAILHSWSRLLTRLIEVSNWSYLGMNKKHVFFKTRLIDSVSCSTFPFFKIIKKLVWINISPEVIICVHNNLRLCYGQTGRFTWNISCWRIADGGYQCWCQRAAQCALVALKIDIIWPFLCFSRIFLHSFLMFSFQVPLSRHIIFFEDSR